MSKQVYKTIVPLSFSALLLASMVYAQYGRVVANIPFDFTVGKTTLPSGEYTVTPTHASHVLIQSKDNRHSAIAATMRVESGNVQDGAKLVFNRYGDRHFLAKIWDNSTGRELYKSRSEIELAGSVSKPETTTLAAKKQ
jgi:hypothetical protein